GLATARALSVRCCPFRPALPQVITRPPTPVACQATFLNPLCERVLFSEIGLSRLSNDGRRVKSFALPGETAIDHPLQDAGGFLAQLLRQILIGISDRDGEGD